MYSVLHLHILFFVDFFVQQETERVQSNLKKTLAAEADSTSGEIPNMALIKEKAKQSAKQEVIYFSHSK